MCDNIFSIQLQLSGDIKGVRVGLLKEGFDPSFEAGVNDMVRTSAKRLIEKGAVVKEVSIPWHLEGIIQDFNDQKICMAICNLFKGSECFVYNYPRAQRTMNEKFECIVHSASTVFVNKT